MLQETWDEIRREWKEAVKNILAGRPDRADLMVSPKLIVNSEVTMTEILNAVATASNIPVKNLKGQSRKRRFCRARSAAIYLMGLHCHDRTSAEIGRFMGRRDHTTVLHSLRVTAERLTKRDEDVVRIVACVCEDLGLPR